VSYAKRLYAHCQECLEELEKMENAPSPQEYSRMAVGATTDGALLIECNRHKLIIAHIPNDKIADEIFKLGSQTCRCGRNHEEEKTH
jgi:hypothetical protein